MEIASIFVDLRLVQTYWEIRAVGSASLAAPRGHFSIQHVEHTLQNSNDSDSISSSSKISISTKMMIEKSVNSRLHPYLEHPGETRTAMEILDETEMMLI